MNFNLAIQQDCYFKAQHWTIGVSDAEAFLITHGIRFLDYREAEVAQSLQIAAQALMQTQPMGTA